VNVLDGGAEKEELLGKGESLRVVKARTNIPKKK
jgi:hypothetical protein